MSIYWYCPDSVNSHFEKPEHNPSFRLRCWTIHKKLLEEGYSSHIVSRATDIWNPSVIVLMSFGFEEICLTKYFSDKGVSVIHDYCENIRGLPFLEETKSLCRFIVCCSTWLGEEESKTYPSKVRIIKDHYESIGVMKNFNHKRKKKKVVWAGMGGNADIPFNLIKPIVEGQGLEYVEISDRDEATIKWSENYLYHMADCDIAICPQDHWSFPAKSNVKVTTAMSLGLPVIASPVRSYEEIITNGVNGFISHSLEDWSNNIFFLSNNNVSEEFYNKSRDILKDYSLDSIYKKWLALFKECL